MKRIYHHYKKLEEFYAGMWKTILGEEREILIKKAVEFTGNAELYGSFMLRIIKEWPLSCEHNLSCDAMNRQAWIGHAACCLALGCPEDITRVAWHHLIQEQQDRANARADFAISEWEKRITIEDKKKCQSENLEFRF